jgi:hypothetical protein
MKVIFIIGYNPWVQSTAASNRLLTIIEGLEDFGAEVVILFYEGFHYL